MDEKEKFKPAIVVIGFNRPQSLKRLLYSLSTAQYSLTNIPLCICIDFQDSSKNKEVVEIAKKFKWEFGQKRIIHQKKNLGLREHVLRSGDLVNEYGSIIMMEDDLFVSPFFYTYTTSCLAYYSDDCNIGGISLNNYEQSEVTGFPFRPIIDGYDVYFLKIASSRGQAWTANMWNCFRIWQKEEFVNDPVWTNKIPEKIYNWPESSWKKLFIIYLNFKNQYFVYPRNSYTTNFGEKGTNTIKNSTQLQVTLVYRTEKFRLIKFENSFVKYDSYFEIEPAFFKTQKEKWKEIDFSVDLYGKKPNHKIDTKYVLTTKEVNRKIESFGLQTKPIESNIIFNIPGEKISLSLTKDIKSSNGFFSGRLNREAFEYLFGRINSMWILYIAISILKDGMKRKLK